VVCFVILDTCRDNSIPTLEQLKKQDKERAARISQLILFGKNLSGKCAKWKGKKRNGAIWRGVFSRFSSHLFLRSTGSYLDSSFSTLEGFEKIEFLAVFSPRRGDGEVHAQACKPAGVTEGTPENAAK
jgi:hypothetical protein